MINMWGHNSSGQLGSGTTNTAYSPLAVIGLKSKALLRLSLVSACALGVSGEVHCWGANAYGQLGNGGNSQQLMPIAVIWP